VIVFDPPRTSTWSPSSISARKRTATGGKRASSPLSPRAGTRDTSPRERPVRRSSVLCLGEGRRPVVRRTNVGGVGVGGRGLLTAPCVSVALLRKSQLAPNELEPIFALNPAR
jgi:hypothetical protein